MATTSTIFNQELMDKFHYSRRVLLVIPTTTLQQYHPETTVAPPPATGISLNTTDDQPSFDAKVVMVLSVLICSIICSFIANCIVKCALRCASRRVLANSYSSNHTNPSVAKLANTGIKKKALKTFPVINYTREILMKYPGVGTECVICLSEFGVGEKVKVLPKCNHGFHVKCIDKWLNSHSSCPTCRHCLIQTCQKIVNGGTSVTTTAIPNTQVATTSAPVQEIIIGIQSLQPEGVVSNNLS
ncbi:PREDICTED: RING-H2 finger protein ATL78-like [Nicotiana attenuata]|uniref:RING-type E3 ubiquitin transferase n=1 Tax=Nicotiana attenuata TaxID=49451 RepID=A0A1J6K2G3_NICAT|nr:PREDICTED: RING-H2 finger protein ATL78-like [Nicotiana attenuata]OIT24237.1 ring-h2 finger protein atl78 [Nicotiana attenuata]